MYAQRVYNFLRITQITSKAGFKSRVICEVPAAQQGDLEPEDLEQRSGVFLMLGDCCPHDLAGALFVAYPLAREGQRDQVSGPKLAF